MRPDVLIAAALAVVVIAIYAPWLGNEFVYDDAQEIVEWTLMHSPRNIPEFFTTADVGLYRPLKYAIVSVLWAVGGGRPGAFHLAALLAHAIGAILLFVIYRRLNFSSAAAGFGAFLFAVHPAQAESVFWISAISAPISTALLFGAFLAALRVTASSKAIHLRLGVGASLILLLFALLVREASVMFPAFLLLYAVSPIRPFASRSGRTHFAILTMASIVLVVAFWFWRSWLMSGQPHEFEYFAGSFERAALSVPYLITRYLIISVIPVGLTVYHWPRIAESIFSPIFLMPAATLGAVLWLLWRRRREQPGGMFFFGCFVAALFPVLNLVPINSVFAERYLYLPMFGFCGLAAMGLEALRARYGPEGHSRMIMIAAAGLLAVFAMLTFARGKVWQNDVTLFSDATEKTPPHAIVPRYNLAKALAARGETHDAIDAYREVIIVDPRHVPALLNLSNLLVQSSELDMAEQALIQADNASPGNSFVLNGLGGIWFRRGADERALFFFEAAAEAQPPNPQAHFNAGMACKRLGRADGARRWFSQAIALNPDYAAARAELARLEATP